MEKSKVGRARRSGLTLMEVTVTGAILFMLLGSTAVVFTAMTTGTAETDRRLTAEAECERGLLTLVNDLQTTDSIGKDGNGVPYFQVTGGGSGILFRQVESFKVDVAQDLVTSIFGNPISYSLDSASNLVREQNSQKQVVANRVSDIKFALNTAGCISIDITAFNGTDSRRVEAKSTIQITPRNAMKM